MDKPDGGEQMSLDRVFQIESSGAMIWARHQPDSPISVLARPLEIEGGAASDAQRHAVTIRVRFRPLPIDSILLDTEGQRWIVTQTHEYQRNRWLDVNLSTYRQPATARAQAPAPDYLPPAGWGLTVNGAPWANLEIATVQATNAQARHGAFALPEGLQGHIADRERAGVWYFRLADTGEVGCFELIAPDNLRLGYLRLRFFDDGAGAPVTALADVPERPGYLYNSAIPLGAGDVLELLGGAP